MRSLGRSDSGSLELFAILMLLFSSAFAYGSGFGPRTTYASPFPDTQLNVLGGDDQVTLRHLSGDPLKAGAWKVSITPPTATVAYCTMPRGLQGGDELRLTATTSRCGAAGGAGEPLGFSEYKIVIVDATTNTVLFDRVVTVT
ncbi:MAG TPA: hypothetical protein VNZ52_06340 [Candidatus Thermoplasmatota archaeon]|nr:hypothetical protein [Candidatus Thermoplasmatota archaeon]